MKNSWWMINVVWYDGGNAYVSKFIGQFKTSEDENGLIKENITSETISKIEEYLSGNGEVLKFDALYPMDFDNITALKNYENSKDEYEIEQFAAYERFKAMWF